MIVTGYQLREAIKRREMERDLAYDQFIDALYAFEGEKKDPVGAMQRYGDAEEAIVKLQTAQIEYNFEVWLDEKEIPLAEAVKRIGMQARIKNLWAIASKDTSRAGFFGRAVRTRSKEDEYAQRTLDMDRAVESTMLASRYLSELRAEVAVANATEVDIDWLDSAWLV